MKDGTGRVASARRRIAIVAIAGFIASSCVGLGIWQLQRLADRRAANASIERERSREPLPLPTDTEGSLAPYTRVRATGRFDADHEVLVYGGTHDGEPGYRLVTPLVLDDGTALLVIRGWVPFTVPRAPVPQAAPRTGVRTVEGFVAPDEGDGSTVPDGDGIIGRLDVRGIGSTEPYPVRPSAIQLLDRIAPSGGLPIPLGWPPLSEGPHLSYAIQWFSFAMIAVIGAIVLLRRDRLRATRPAP